MSTDYDAIVSEYKRSKFQPWRRHIEAHTFFELIGDVSGKQVLDLACGEGFYTRQLKRRGAARVVGVDLSQGMIDMARGEEAYNPLGIEYWVQDGKTLDVKDRFDLVVAAYLLNYASTREELLTMCQGIRRCLKPDCRFVTVNNNPAQPPEYFWASKPYGFEKILAEELQEGAPINYRIYLEEKAFEITNFYLSAETHEWALRSAGLGDIRWHQPRVSADGVAEFGEGFWTAFLEHPPVIFLDCVNQPC